MDKAAILINELEKAGHRTFIVGGAVRNQLLGIPQKDIDLVTLGRPEDVCRVADKNNWKTIQVGRQFGIVVVIIEGKAFEVASARRESYGQDSHRPRDVSFVSDIKEDLARRDFTINAMALDSSGKLIDPFGGQRDLEKRIIRAVGDPVRRFSEDGLRPFRAVRFAAQLGFTVEPGTLEAISKTLFRVKGLSAERVYSELEKILLSPFAAYGLELLVITGLAGCTCIAHIDGKKQSVGILKELLHLYNLEQNPRYHFLNAWEHTLAAVDLVPPDPVLRWAALFHDAGKGTEGVRCLNKRGEIADPGHAKVSAVIPRSVLSRLGASRCLTNSVVWLVENHMSLPILSHKAVVKWLKKRAAVFSCRREMEEAVGRLLALCRADVSAGKVNPNPEGIDILAELFAVVLNQVPFYHGDLAISGKEVADRLGSGPQVSRFLDNLLERIQGGELANDYEELKAALENKVRRTFLS